jgi:four helix bundle protein
VWKEAMQLVKHVYQLTANFSSAEKYGLTSQTNRAAVSVLINIAEGATRDTDKEYLRFLNISEASLSEVDALFEIAHELKMLSCDEYKNISLQINKVSAMLSGLKKYVTNRVNNTPKS